jgi:protein Tex
VLEGAVTNVAAFGAFVDIGVHQDGLVHVSAMSKTFVKDAFTPRLRACYFCDA